MAQRTALIEREEALVFGQHPAELQCVGPRDGARSTRAALRADIARARRRVADDDASTAAAA